MTLTSTNINFSAPDDESSVLSKRRVCRLSDDGKSSNTRQWYLACDTTVYELYCRITYIYQYKQINVYNYKMTSYLHS
jgi:hypothetical protein